MNFNEKHDEELRHLNIKLCEYLTDKTALIKNSLLGTICFYNNCPSDYSETYCFSQCDRIEDCKIKNQIKETINLINQTKAKIKIEKERCINLHNYE
jgi:hypothetical protein